MKIRGKRSKTAAAAGLCKLAPAALLLATALVGCDGGDDSSATGGGGAGGSGGGAGGSGGSSCNSQVEVPSTQQVNVEILNGSAEDRYLLTSCFECDLLRVERKGDVEYSLLPTRITAQEACGCECPFPGDAYASGFLRIPPGLTVTTTWDARVLTRCTTQQDCGGGSTAEITQGALHPADPGDYRVSFGVIVHLPAECMEQGATGEYTCGPPAVPGIDPGGDFYPVEFTLPASGGVNASMTVP